MNKPKRRLWMFLGCAVVLVLTQRAQSEWKLQGLLQSQALAAPPSYDPQRIEARNRRARQLYQQLYQL